MFIKTIVKTDKKTGKRYDYYRLCESYRLSGKPRHRTIITLGLLEKLELKEERKLLADRIEDMLKGTNSLFLDTEKPHIENYAKIFYSKIVSQKLYDVKKNKYQEQSGYSSDYQNIDLNSLITENAKEIGAEWLVSQAIKQLEIDKMLKDQGFEEKQIKIAVAHIISRCVYPASENMTANWINENSGLLELPGFENLKINKNHLYEISRKLYSVKDQAEEFLSSKTNELFDLQDTVILYDLTNTYFEGVKKYSNLAAFGRSKEKRSDARLISLALVVNVFGFVKYSKIYAGNISDGSTLKKTISDLEDRRVDKSAKPVIAMDAGFSSEANIEFLKENGYDYISVSRKKLKDYTLEKDETNQVVISDKRKGEIKLSKVNTKGDETILYVKSENKVKKENSMVDKIGERFEQGLQEIKLALSKKGGTKKEEKVHQRIGRLREKYKSVHNQYSIETVSNNGKVTSMKWKKVKNKKLFSGIYFIRTSLNDSEENLFKIYNTLTEIEASFRVLKTDLSLRPVYHQTDKNTLAHINLGILAYQVVSSIRYQLKQKDIHYDWRNIVRIMNTQKTVTNSMKNKKGQKIIIRTCSLPTVKAKQIYETLNYKHAPFYRLKSVLPEI
jgi:transposase